jgi:predicted RND superfamily exporter protein
MKTLMSKITTFLENMIFGHRVMVLVLVSLFTILMGVFASRTRIDAGFLKQLPLEHPYIKTFVQYQEQFGGANRVIIALTVPEGDLFNPEFFAALKGVTNEVFFIPGVDRSSVTSLFTPNVRFVEIVEDGFSGGNVIPADFEPTPEHMEVVRQNIIKSGRVGQLVSNDFTGAIVQAQLLDVDPSTGVKLDYIAVAKYLEEKIRNPYVAQGEGIGLRIHIIGFARLMGDISEGALEVLAFLGISIVITAVLVFLYVRSFRLTLWTLTCSMVAVVWQLGLLNALGFGIDPLSILVPFLIFAIGVSHAVQMVRAFRNAVFVGAGPEVGARTAFRNILVPGAIALITDTIGFITMILIKIEIIRELAITASLGVGLIIITNLVLLPALLSTVTLSKKLRTSVKLAEPRTRAFWRSFNRVTEPIPATVIIVVAIAAAAFGARQSAKVQIGDLDAGSPELRLDSRYNRDTAIITERFSIGVDILSVIVETVPNGCIDTEIMSLINDFEWHLRNVPGVQSTISLSSVAKVLNAGWNEGSLKWRIIPENPQVLAQAISPIETSSGMLNADGSVMPVVAFLSDHKAETITAVVAAVKEFSEAHPSDRVKFRLASGSVGVMAATNEVVHAAQFPIVAWVFGAVILLCLITFQSIRATLCIVLPLTLVSLLSYALMVYLGIGLKPQTLPVVALGVGIGVDYGIYLFSRLQESFAQGKSFAEAMPTAFVKTGSSVMFTGVTLAAGVTTWIFSDLKWQADMGILLTFMFLVNMLAAIIVLPALARWFYVRKNVA